MMVAHRCVFTGVCCAAVLLWSGQAHSQAVIFEDDLDDNSAGWSFDGLDSPFFGTLAEAIDALNSGTRIGSLGIAGYDYSVDSVPEAPNSDPSGTATTGFRVATNLLNGGAPVVDGEVVEADQAAFSIDNPGFTGRYTVQTDMYLSFSTDPSLAGTTEHGGVFVGKDTVQNPINPAFPISQGAGTLFSSDGDCFNCDYILLKNESELDLASGQYSVQDFGFGNQNGYDNTDINTDPENGPLINLPAAFPALDPIQQDGSVAFRWLTVTIEVDPDAPGMGDNGSTGTAKFSIEYEDVSNPGETASFVIGTVDNSVDDDPNDEFDTGEEPVDLTGRISLALVDFFPSIARDPSEAFIIFDNVKVFQTPLAGDFNGDGFVNAADYTNWRDGFATGDFTLDDYAEWKANFGAGTPPAAGASPTPEPTAVVLGLLPLLGLGRYRS